MTETWLAPGIWKVTEDRVSLFVGQCDEGCHWLLSPEYLAGGWSVTHSTSPEAVLRLERAAIPEPFDPAAFMSRVEGWLDQCHAYVTARRPGGGEG